MVSPDHPEALQQLEGVQVITGDLSISGAESLTELAALVHVQGDLHIYTNPALHSLAGLEQLTRIGGDLRIAGTPSLASLTALHALKEVGGTLSLSGTTGLEQLSGLEQLTRIGGDLQLSSNDALQDLAALKGLTSVAGALELVGNDALVSASLGGEWGEGPSIGGHVQILDNAGLLSLEHFGTLERRDGPCDVALSDVWVSSNDRLETITLPLLMRRQACINIFDNPQLTTLAGGDAGWLDTLMLLELPRLSTVDLHFVEVRRLSILKTGLTSLAGFGSVSCQLSVSDNPALTSLGDFASFPGAVGASIIVTDNPSLPQCAVDAMLKALPEARLLCVDPVTSTAPTTRLVDADGNDSQAACTAS